MSDVSTKLREAAEALIAVAGEMEKKPEPPAEVPDEWELTGERRVPKDGDAYLLGGMKVTARGDHFCDAPPMWILRKKPAGPTVESVYGKPLAELTPPQGWLFTGEFRKPNGGEWFMTRFGIEICRSWSLEDSYPRLILRRVPEKKPRRWVFMETGEVREPRGSEYYLCGGDIFCSEGTAFDRFPILRLVERPE